LLQVPCGEARAVPVGTCAGARELPQLSRPARLHQRLPAQDFAAAAMPAVPREPDRTSRQSAQSEVDLRSQPRVPELPLAASRLEESVRVAVASLTRGGGAPVAQ